MWVSRMAFRSATRRRLSSSRSRRVASVEPGPGSISTLKCPERTSAVAIDRACPIQFRSSRAVVIIGDKVYRKRVGPVRYRSQDCLPSQVHFRKCLQNDELMEYAFPRGNEFHFATASIDSKTGVKPPPYWTSMWFAAYCSASPFCVLADIDGRRTRGIYEIVSFD